MHSDNADLIELNCTLGDGGYYNDLDFSCELIELYHAAMKSARLDVVEVGFVLSKKVLRHSHPINTLCISPLQSPFSKE